MALQPEAFWDDLLPTVQLGLRVAVSSAHGYSPFVVVFGQPPELPGLQGILQEGDEANGDRID